MTGLTDFLRGSWVLTLLTVQLGYRTLMVVIWMQSKLQQLHCIWRQAACLLGGVLPSWWCHQCCRNPTSLCTLPRITKSPLVHCVSSSAARSTCANQRDGACLSGLIYTPWSNHTCCGHQSWLFSLALSLHGRPRLFDPLLAGQQCGRRNWSKAAWTRSRCCSQRR